MNPKTRNKFLRCTALALTGVIFAPQAAPLALAAAPQPATDEAVYVNLDEYGALSDMRVVKGVTLNGATSLSDYGSYAEVNNLTSHDEPQMREDGVDFTLNDVTGSRFYYECVPNDPSNLQMPWTFDVSYKLDGVPAKAEDLAGASGLVEISIHAIPNAAADEYYRNNMTLMVATGANMDETKSLEAPGAQIQSLGSYKFAVFLGLPGEENTYTVRIGSDDFESMGVYMLMAPATLSQLDTITDLRNARDTLSNAHDDLYNGLSAMLTTMSGMQSGVQSMADGMAGIDQVRQQLIASRGTIDPDIDAALSQLELLAGSSDALIPELDTVQTNLNAFHENLTEVLTQLADSREDIGDYQTLLTDLRRDLSSLEDLMDDLDDEASDDLYLSQIQSALKALGTDADNLSGQLSDLRGALSNLQHAKQILAEILGTLPEDSQLVPPISQLLGLLQSIANETGNTFQAVEDLCGSLRKLTDASASMVGQLEDLKDVLDDYRGLGGDMASLGQQATELAQNTLTRLDELLAQVDPIQQTLTQINTDANALVPKVKDTATALNDTVKAANTLLTDTRDTLRSLRDQADASTQQSLDGLIDVMQRAANSGSTTNSLQTATDSIHNTISDEVNDIEDDSNILNIDNSLALRSFTSSENASPSSLQFILRTSEISVDEMAEVQAEEAEEADVGVWARIVNIFKKIAAAIASVF
ncbi:MAG: hypothetical protein Q3Y08_08365 [Butyricicoccus sp.]|nr:hypothetical protein [Butyricicoccus sp.]